MNNTSTESLLKVMELVHNLRKENDRLLAGDFTKEEIHKFCHKLPETVSRCEFEQGCREYQNKLYGESVPSSLSDDSLCICYKDSNGTRKCPVHPGNSR